MSKKNLILIVVLCSIIGAYFLFRKDINNSTSLRKDFFAIKEINDIDKIFISSNQDKSYVILSRNKQNVWYVNDKWILNASRLKILLETAKDMEVKYQVNDNDKKEIMAHIATIGFKAMYYKNNRLMKSYFIGSNTLDLMGTFIVAEGSNNPAVVHIPGFNGFLTTRFFTDSIEWRDKNIFNIPASQIKNLSVVWNNQPEQSFSINQQDKTIEFSPLIKVAAPNFNELKVKSFLNIFSVYEKNNLACEGFHKKFTKRQVDSIMNSQWFYKIEITKQNGEKTSLKLYRKPIQINTYEAYDTQGNPLEYEIDKYWGVKDDEPMILEIQDLVFDKILKGVKDFN